MRNTLANYGEYDMIRKIFAVALVLLALGTGYFGAKLALTNLDAEPILAEAPEDARNQVIQMMDALCAGDYAEVGKNLYGKPDLGIDRQPADYVGQLFFAAYAENLRYELVRDCYATADGVALDLKVTALDIYAVLPHLRQQAESMLEQWVAEAEDVSEIYDENGEYLDSMVQEVLHASAAKVLEDKRTISLDLTLECVYENGQWWIRPNNKLLDLIGCKLGKQEVEQ